MGGLSAFLVQLDAVIRSNGRDYIVSAAHPEADGETLDADYSVTISKGPAQIINKHGHPINM